MIKKNLKFKIQNLKLLTLIGIAIVLLVAINNQQKLKKAVSPSPSPNISTQPRLLPSNLTEDERFILNPPSEDASRSAKDKHAQTVAKLAKEGTVLEIKDCQPTPLVLQLKARSDFQIKNSGKEEITILLDEEHQYKIPGQSSKTIKAEFKYGNGDYGYICEGTGLIGFLHITP